MANNKRKNRSGADVHDWFQLNPDKSLEDLLSAINENHNAIEPTGWDGDHGNRRRVFTGEELKIPGVSLFIEPPDEPKPSTTTQYQPNEDERVSELLSWSREDKNGRKSLLMWVANIKLIFQQHSKWSDKIKLNDRDKCIYLFPGTPISIKSDKPQKLSDTHYTDTIEWIENTYSVSFKKNMVADVMQSVGYLQSYDPVRDYFDSLKWDNTQRAENWMINATGAADTLYTRAVSKRFLISVVARTYDPGCKVDTMLILSGKQGIGKSTLFSLLAGPPENFTDHLEKLSSKDSKMQLQGPMIIEMAELSEMSRAEVGDVKQFLTTQEDKFRPPYGRNDIFCPRRCVFVGTTNETNYLKDSTGGRRFWPVPVQHVKKQMIQNNREQLWAEAVEWYKLGVNWWLSDEEEEPAKHMQDNAGEIGAFDEMILNYITKPKTSVKEDWWYCFNNEGKRWCISIHEIQELMELSARDVQATAVTIKKSIERIIRSNIRVRKTISSHADRPKFFVYILPDEFIDTHCRGRTGNLIELPLGDSADEMPF